MSRNYSCPVCGRRGLPPGCARCPQCDADLTCFQVLDALSEPAAAVVPAKKSRPRRRFFLLAALLFLAAALLAALALSMRNRVKELDRQLAELKTAETQAAAIVKKQEKAAPPVQQEKPSVPTTAERAEALARLKEEIAASAGTIQVRISDDRKDEDGSAKPSAETAAEQKEEAETAGEEDKSDNEAAAADDRPAADVLPQPPSEEKAKTEEQLAVRPENLPVLRASPKRRLVREKQSAPAVKEEQQEIAAVRTPQLQSRRAVPARTFLYQAQDGETLQDIAERFYGDRRYYPVILEQNPYLLSSISSGNWMRLFADSRQAAAVYARRAEQQDGLLLWKYEVRPGETWRTIYARFFPSRYSGRVFYDKNPQIVPGSTVLIILR